MNGIALMLATAALGIDYGWQHTPDGWLEYVIQIEPELLQSLAEGEQIVSEIHPDVRGVRRFRIQVGSGRVRREPLDPAAPADPPEPSFGRRQAAAAQAGWSETARPLAADSGQLASGQLGGGQLPRGQAGFATRMASATVAESPPPPLTVPSGVGQAPYGPAPSYGRLNPGPPPTFTAPGLAEARFGGPYGGTAQSTSANQPSLPGPPPAGGPAVTTRLVTDGAATSSEPPQSARQQPAEVDQKPWGWLALTGLALFASVGTNLFQGWTFLGLHRRYRRLLHQHRQDRFNDNRQDRFNDSF